MRLRYAGLIGLGMGVRGCLGTPSIAAQSAEDYERECCGAYMEEDARMMYTGKSGGGMMPAVCVQHKVGCPALGIQPPVGTTSAIEAAINHQVDLRSRPSCDKSEWHSRCRAGSTMLLTNSRSGCVAAGCTPLGGAVAAASVEEEVEDAEGEAILRAIVAQEVNRLSEIARGTPPTMYRHSSRLRKEFVKGQKTLQKKLKKVLNSHTGLHELRLLLDEADSKGFQGAEIERARRIMKDYDRQQWLPFCTSLADVDMIKTTIDADVDEGMDSCLAEIKDALHELIDLRTSSAILEKETRIAQEHGNGLKEELASCLSTVKSEDTNSTNSNVSSGLPSCDCGGQDLSDAEGALPGEISTSTKNQDEVNSLQACSPSDEPENAHAGGVEKAAA